MTAKVSISRASDDRVHFEIQDEDSRVHILSMSMDLESFAKCVTGQGGMSANLDRITTVEAFALIGRHRKNWTVTIPKLVMGIAFSPMYFNGKDRALNKKRRKVWIEEYLIDNDLLPKGAEVLNYGLDTQQNHLTDYMVELCQWED